jgi:mRNA interferase YafQ
LKPAAKKSKRAKPPRNSHASREFRKDWERLTHSGRYDMTLLKSVMVLLIANDGPLSAEWKDHALTGQWGQHRECHVGGDFLLIYRLDGESIYFVRAGTHAELFE